MKLTGNQIEKIRQLQQYLKGRVAGQGARPENVAAAMEELCENLGYEEALCVCQGIWQGADKMSQLCMDQAALTKPDYIEAMLDQITAHMGREQKKGFFLQSLDAFCKNQSSEEDTASRAALPLEDLKGLLAERIRQFSDSAACHMAEAAEAPCFLAQGGNSPEKVEIGKEDAFLFAAAEYIAGLNGVLPHEFGEYPELLGISAVAQMAIGEQARDGQEEGQPKILFGILHAAVGAALALGIVAAGAAAGPVLLAMESSALGLILSIFLSTILCFLLVVNCMMAIGAVSAILGACMDKAAQGNDREDRKGRPSCQEEAKKEFQDGWAESQENEETASIEEVMA